MVTATEIIGDNAATWNPSIHVLVPGGMAAGTYSATITQSVLWDGPPASVLAGYRPSIPGVAEIGCGK